MEIDLFTPTKTKPKIGLKTGSFPSWESLMKKTPLKQDPTAKLQKHRNRKEQRPLAQLIQIQYLKMLK